jgi:uroporphyrinogen-III synthase
VFRKRKIFFGKQTIEDLIEIMNKHNGEKFLVPSADIQKQRINEVLEENKIRFKRAVMYKTVCSELGAINIYNYDILVFFSPLDVKSLIKNFPKFKQNSTRIAAFGPTVSKAVSTARLRLDIMAPMPGAPSMPMVLAQYLKKVNK